MFFELLSLAVGAGVSAYGQSKQSSSIKKQNASAAKSNALQKQVSAQQQLASAASVRAEQLRLQQMELEGIRRRRDIIRSAQGAASLGKARANSQGALMSSSAMAGQQQLASQQRADTLANVQNIMIGRQIFKENEAIYKAQSKGATIQTQANIAASQSQQYGNSAQYGQQIFGAGIQLAQNAQAINRVGTQLTQGAYNLFNPNPWQTTTYGYGELK